MDRIEIIEKKKFGKELKKEEIRYWIKNYVKGTIPDYQSAALLMAIRLNGRTKQETFNLNEARRNSGETLDLSKIPGVKVDKHSTGGVGDKTSMALCPRIAALGLKVAKRSGRGLGFTGGTLDKLESIPGRSTTLSPHSFVEQVTKIGRAIIGQSEEIDPADKKLYALRDVTGTVDAIPLIASSIRSKKLAAGCDCILLDVKYGSGAFMPTKESAEELAKCRVEIGNYFHKDVRAEITNRNEPLGKAVGNILEVEEAVRTLLGKGPKDFTELCLSSGATLLMQAKVFDNREDAIHALKETITSGSALKVFKAFVKAQGGDVSYIDDRAKFPKARYSFEVRSVKEGYVSARNTRGIGLVSRHLGAGRETKDDIIDTTAGLIINKKIGDKVNKGDVLVTRYSERPNISSLSADILNDYDFSDSPVPPQKVVEELISRDKEGNFIIEKE